MKDLFGIYKHDEELIQEQIEKVNGLNYYPNFLSLEEEQEVLNEVDSQEWLGDLKRKVQHYGFKYDYRARKIDESFRIGPLPSWSEAIIKMMRGLGVIDFQPDQLIVNNYEPGEGIAMHVDCEPCFTDTIVSLSLGSDVVMNFKELKSSKKYEILLQRRSLLVISGESRYDYEHGISERKSDVYNETKRVRRRRVSLTFRQVILD